MVCWDNYSLDLNTRYQHRIRGISHAKAFAGVAFRENLNVPLVITDPRHRNAVRTDAVGSHLDLVPTILADAGLPDSQRQQRYPCLRDMTFQALCRIRPQRGQRPLHLRLRPEVQEMPRHTDRRDQRRLSHEPA